jgi:hypothetical protein
MRRVHILSFTFFDSYNVILGKIAIRLPIALQHFQE